MKRQHQINFEVAKESKVGSKFVVPEILCIRY